MTTLVTIPFSHYCEKARWALDRGGIAYDEAGHLPIFHYRPTRRAGGRRTVPVLVDGDTVLTDSTDIVAWADARAPGAIASPTESVALEDELDRELGPATRRWAYHQLLPRRDLDRLIARGVPRWEFTAFRLARPLAVAMLRRSLAITPAGVEASCQQIEDVLARITARLRDGRRYLTGDRFTAADLTFAALASPILLPPEHPFPLPRPADFPDAPRAQIERWRATPAGAFALRLYATERTPR